MSQNKIKEIKIPYFKKTKKISLIELDEVDSTSNYLKEFHEDGERKELVVRTKFQTHGRGRGNSVWKSPKGRDLLFSVLLYPEMSTIKTPMITILVAEAIAEVLGKQSQKSFTIKRPNDVLCGKKKIAGILTEEESHGNKVDYLIVGVGLNVNSRKSELLKTATSLYVESKSEYDLESLFTQILTAFFEKTKGFTAS